MAAPIPKNLSGAVAQGDVEVVRHMLSQGADPNEKAKDGMTPLGVAAFWGYSDITECLIQNGADINGTNVGTLWTPLHCASFQGHGPVIMKLLKHKPVLDHKDHKGRTAADFASALDSVWPLFADAGCKRTPRSELLNMGILHTGSVNEAMYEEEYGPGAGTSYGYNIRHDAGDRQHDPNMEFAAITGDVLADTPDTVQMYERKGPSLHVFNQ